MSRPLSKSEVESVGRPLSDDEKQWPPAENPEWLKPKRPAKKASRPCHCSAYDFPHSLGGGDCVAPYAIEKGERKPSCSDCPHGMACVDPLGTSDSPTEYECTLPSCPWEQN